MATSKLYLVIWASYPLLFPFFVLGRTPVPSLHESMRWAQKVEGGVPQPADYAMAGLMGAVFLGIGFSVARSAVSALRVLALFVIYAGLVNAIWSLVLQDWSLWKSSLFYLYDFLLFLMFLVLHSRFGDMLLRVTLYSVAASVFVQVLLSPLAHHQGWLRQTLFFSNENQLGYFTVLAATLFFVGTKHFPVPVGIQLCFYGAIAYLAILSLSKAALFSLGLLAVLACLERPATLFKALAGVALIVIALSMAPNIMQNLERRLATPHVDDSFAGRGYDRIVNHPEYLLFGAGEGVYHRFQSAFPGELHSSLGTLLFCYGVIGLGLFLFGLYLICRPNLRYVIYLLPMLCYSFAHQGMRFSLFWVVLAFLACILRSAPWPSQAWVRDTRTMPIPA